MAPTWRLKLTMSKVSKSAIWKCCHAQARQGQQVDAADAAAAGDRDALAAQDLLFGRRHPADIAGKRLFIAERIVHRGRKRLSGKTRPAGPPCTRIQACCSSMRSRRLMMPRSSRGEKKYG
jgi:hypothetical protein